MSEHGAGCRSDRSNGRCRSSWCRRSRRRDHRRGNHRCRRSDRTGRCRRSGRRAGSRRRRAGGASRRSGRGRIGRAGDPAGVDGGDAVVENVGRTARLTTGRVGRGDRWRLTGRELRRRWVGRGSHLHGDVLDGPASRAARDDHGGPERDADTGEHIATVELGEREVVRRGGERREAERQLRRGGRHVEPTCEGYRGLDRLEHTWRHQGWRPPGALGGRLAQVCFRQSGHAAVHDSAFVGCSGRCRHRKRSDHPEQSIDHIRWSRVGQPGRTGRPRPSRLSCDTCPDAHS